MLKYFPSIYYVIFTKVSIKGEFKKVKRVDE